jgi:hypothetical protein
VRQALKEAGYATNGAPSTVVGATHDSLAARTGIDRRTISRICSTRKNLTLNEAEAILSAIGRDELYRTLVEPVIERAAAIHAWVEEELEPIYETLWMERSGLRADERLALEDQHWLYQEWQHSSTLARLPFAERREATLERFTASHGREPHPVPASLRRRAEDSLLAQREHYRGEEDRLRKQFGEPKVTGTWVRDLKRRAVAYGLFDNLPVRPATYRPNVSRDVPA